MKARVALQVLLLEAMYCLVQKGLIDWRKSLSKFMDLLDPTNEVLQCFNHLLELFPALSGVVLRSDSLQVDFEWAALWFATVIVRGANSLESVLFALVQLELFGLPNPGVWQQKRLDIITDENASVCEVPFIGVFRVILPHGISGSSNDDFFDVISKILARADRIFSSQVSQ